MNHDAGNGDDRDQGREVDGRGVGLLGSLVRGSDAGSDPQAGRCDEREEEGGRSDAASDGEEDAEKVTLVIRDGRILFLWHDALAGLAKASSGQITRASHVEPTSSGQWTADLSPRGGPVLGPFALRGQALAAERDWLNEHL